MKKRHLAMSVVAAIVFAVALTGCGPYVGAHPWKGLLFALDAATCMREPSTGQALVQFSVKGRRDLGRDPVIVGVKVRDVDDVAVVGTDLLAPGVLPFAIDTPPGTAELKAMRNNADKAWLGASVERDEASTLVLLIQGIGAHDEDGRLRIYWSGGEPVCYQEIALADLPGC